MKFVYLNSKFIQGISDKTKALINYRPIATLCSASKIFERLILNRILELEFLNNVDLTEKLQHGFKKKHITSTIGLLLQSFRWAAKCLQLDLPSVSY